MGFFDVFGLIILAALIGGASAGLLGVFVVNGGSFDGELEADLTRREELIPASKEYAALDRRVKSLLKMKGDQIVVGEFLIRNKVNHKEGYAVKAADYTVTKIVHVKPADGPVLAESET